MAEDSPQKTPIKKRGNPQNLRPPWSATNQPPNEKLHGKRGPHLTTILKRLIACKANSTLEKKFREEYPDISDKKITRAHAHMAKLEELSGKGDLQAMTLLLNYVDGKPTQPLDHKNDGGSFTGQPIIITTDQEHASLLSELYKKPPPAEDNDE